MNSLDPSPWASKPNIWDEPFMSSTADLLEEARRQSQANAEIERAEVALWERLAARMAADGTLIR